MMNYSILKNRLEQSYTASTGILNIDFEQWELKPLSNFLKETNASSSLSIRLDQALQLPANAQLPFSISGRTSIWNQNELFIQFTWDENFATRISFHIAPDALIIPFPDLDTVIYRMLPVKENNQAQLMYHSSTQENDETLSFDVQFPIDQTSAKWDFLLPVLNLDTTNALVSGKLDRRTDGIDFELPLSPRKEVQILSEVKLTVSATLLISTANMAAIRQLEAVEEEEENWPEHRNTAHIRLSAQLNDELTFEATLHSLHRGQIYFVTTSELNLIDQSKLSWLIGDNDLKNWLPENSQKLPNITIKQLELAMNISHLAVLSARITVDVSGHEPIPILSNHLLLENFTLSFFISAPFKKENFLATAQIELAFEDARFTISASFPELNFNLNLVPENGLSINSVAKLFPVTIPELSNMYVSNLALMGGIKPGSPIRFHTRVKDIWSIPIGESSFNIESVRIFYRRERGSGFGLVMGTFRLFELPFELSASSTAGNQGYYLSGGVPENETIDIKTAIKKLGDLFHFNTPENIPDITLSKLNIAFDTATKDFKLSAKAQLNEKIGPIDKGEFTLEIGLMTNVGNNTHEFQLLLTGDLEVEQTSIAFQADLGHADWSIEFDWKKTAGESLHLIKLVQLVAPHADLSKIPQEVNDALSIAAASMSYQHQAKTISIALDTDGGEHAVLIGSFANESFAFLFGIGYQNPNDVPANMGQHLHEIHGRVHLEKLWFLINTLTENHSVPELPKIFPHEIKPTSLGTFTGILATINLQNEHAGTGLHHVANHLGTTELIVVGTVSEKNGHAGVSLRAELKGSIRIPVGHHEKQQDHQTVRIDNYLELENCFIKLAYHASHVELALGGTMHFTIDHVAVSPSLELIISEQGITAEANLLFDNGFQHGIQLFGLDGFYLDQIGLLLGVEFAGPSIQIGLDGAMTFHDNHFLFGIVLAFVGDIPNLEYFALSIDEIDFSKLIATFVGNASTGNQSLKELKGENLSIYWAEKAITLPSGIETRPGFGLHGELDIFGWKVYCDLDIHADSGARGHAEAAKIDWGKFKLYGSGTGVTVNEYQTESGQWKRIRNADRKPLSDYPNHREVVLVPPGGPVIHFDSTHSPFISASVHVKFLEILQADLDLKIASEGVDFNLHWNIKHITHFRLHCSIRDWKELKANGNFFAGIELPSIETVFGPIKVELGVYGNLDVFINEKPTDLKLAINGGLDFMGAELPFVAVDIHDFPDNANELPLWLAKTFAESVFPPLHDLFEAAYKELHHSADSFDQKKSEHAQYILDSITQWIGFINADLAELAQEEHTSYGVARELAMQIREQAAKIRSHQNELTQTMQSNGDAELDRLTQIRDTIQQTVSDKRTRSFTRNRNLMENQRREMRELLDQNRAIRNAIEALWNAHQHELDAVENWSEKSQLVVRISQEIDVEIETLMLPISMPQKTTANAHQFTSEGDYNHHLNVDARFQAYPNIPGKYTPVAVQHHAKMIAIQHISEVQVQAILSEAEAQAAQITHRAEQDTNSTSQL